MYSTIPRKRIIAGILLFAILITASLTAGCTGNADLPTSAEKSEPALSSEVSYTGTDVEKVELFHFHGKSQCVSCVTLGNLAEETVNTYYSGELGSGRLVFGHIDVSLPENREVFERYGPTGSSLWIGVYDQNGFYKQELLGPWYMLNDQPRFEAYIRTIIDQQLG
ncbi:MAG: nitrophenyl compound nitroreductase subunit ArsF family protein [Methanomicrobiaceae archaeon]|nr:nitrophenyl compound nitroreductase subunit ArsF family protein [Methanomicrobiaceae archaeon]